MQSLKGVLPCAILLSLMYPVHADTVKENREQYPWSTFQSGPYHRGYIPVFLSGEVSSKVEMGVGEELNPKLLWQSAEDPLLETDAPDSCSNVPGEYSDADQLGPKQLHLEPSTVHRDGLSVLTFRSQLDDGDSIGTMIVLSTTGELELPDDAEAKCGWTLYGKALPPTSNLLEEHRGYYGQPSISENRGDPSEIARPIVYVAHNNQLVGRYLLEGGLEVMYSPNDGSPEQEWYWQPPGAEDADYEYANYEYIVPPFVVTDTHAFVSTNRDVYMIDLALGVAPTARTVWRLGQAPFRHSDAADQNSVFTGNENPYATDVAVCAPGGGVDGDTIAPFEANANGISLIYNRLYIATSSARVMALELAVADTEIADLAVGMGDVTAEFDGNTQVNPSEVVVSSVMTYPITATNNGPAPVSNVRIIVDLPPSLQILLVDTLFASDPFECRLTGSIEKTVTCIATANLEVGESATLNLIAAITSVDYIDVAPNVSAAELDMDNSNNSTLYSLASSDVPNLDRLALESLTVSQESERKPKVFGYAASSADETLTRLVSAGNQITFNEGSNVGSLVRAMSVSESSVDLSVTSSVNQRSANVGDMLDYTVKVANQAISVAGSSETTGGIAANVELTVSVPASLRPVSTNSPYQCSILESKVRCALGDLALGSSAAIVVKVEALNTDNRTTMLFEVSNDSMDVDLTNNSVASSAIAIFPKSDFGGGSGGGAIFYLVLIFVPLLFRRVR